MSAISSNNWFRANRAHGTAASASSHEHCEDDHVVQDAAELVAATHVADRHEVSIDRSGQLSAWTRLEDHAHSLQSMQSTLHGARTDHVDCCCRSTSMELEHVSVSDSSGKTYLYLRRGRAVTPRTSATRGCEMDGCEMFLRHVHEPFGPAPYTQHRGGSVFLESVERRGFI